MDKDVHSARHISKNLDPASFAAASAAAHPIKSVPLKTSVLSAIVGSPFLGIFLQKVKISNALRAPSRHRAKLAAGA